MKAVAAVVMVVGLTLMSAPLVLPKLGVDVTRLLGNAAWAPKADPAPAGSQGIGGVAAVGGALNQWFGSVGSYLGSGTPSSAAPSSAELAKEFAAVCAALDDGGAGCPDASGGDFAQIFSKAAGMFGLGGTSGDATAEPDDAAAPGGPTPGVLTIGTTPRRSEGGAKFVKARGATAEGDAP